MRPWTLKSTSQLWCRAFTGDECLYVDHEGQRIVGDAEGPGEVVVEGESRIVLLGKGESQGGHATFEDGAIVIAGQGDVRVAIARDTPLTGEPPHAFESAEPARGCGWKLDPGFQVWVPFFGEAVGRLAFDPTLCASTVATLGMADRQSLSEFGWSVKNASDTFELESRFGDGQILRQSHLSHLNTARFQVRIPEHNLGVRIRKLYDRFHGRQRAQVMVDGVRLGWWYLPEEDRQARWAWAEYGICAEKTNGKSLIEIGIDPPPASPLWDVARYEILALLPS